MTDPFTKRGFEPDEMWSPEWDLKVKKQKEKNEWGLKTGIDIDEDDDDETKMWKKDVISNNKDEFINLLKEKIDKMSEDKEFLSKLDDFKKGGKFEQQKLDFKEDKSKGNDLSKYPKIVHQVLTYWDAKQKLSELTRVRDKKKDVVIYDDDVWLRLIDELN